MTLEEPKDKYEYTKYFVFCVRVNKSESFNQPPSSDTQWSFVLVKSTPVF